MATLVSTKVNVTVQLIITREMPVVRLDHVLNELEYDFKSTVPGTEVVDMEIVDTELVGYAEEE